MPLHQLRLKSRHWIPLQNFQLHRFQNKLSLLTPTVTSPIFLYRQMLITLVSPKTKFSSFPFQSVAGYEIMGHIAQISKFGVANSYTINTNHSDAILCVTTANDKETLVTNSKIFHSHLQENDQLQVTYNFLSDQDQRHIIEKNRYKISRCYSHYNP